MRTIIFILVLGIHLNASAQQVYTPVDKESLVSFKIKNFGLPVDGSLNGLQGTIKFALNSIENSSFEVSVNANSINTGINARDKHLLKKEYLDVATYPLIKFTSTKIKPAKESDMWLVTGMLTIKQVTKEVTFPFKAIPKDGNYQFDGSFTINRRDFDVGGSSFSMADTMTITLQVLAQKIQASRM